MTKWWLAAMGLAASAAAAEAADWPQWRGPRGDGVAEGETAPLRWSATENIAWKTPIPGKGHSSPIVWGDKVFVTTALEAEKKRAVLCLDRGDGHMLWQRDVLTAKLEGKNSLNSYASSTPATNGKLVFAAFLDGEQMLAVALDLAGNEAWRVHPGKFASRHGFCSSAVLYQDLVIFNGDHDGDGYVVALEQATGKQRWRIERPNQTRSYCAPFITQAGGRVQMVMAGSKCVAGYDPENGKEWWRIDGPTEQYVASLVYGDETFFLTAGFPTYHLMGIAPDGTGNITKTGVRWHHETNAKEAAYVPSPIAAGKWFFVVSDTGNASCLVARTGERVWQQKLGKHHSASPVAVEDRLYFLADDGGMFVVKAGEKYELVARNELGEECFASPAVSGGRMFVRSVRNVWCVR